MLKNGMRPIHPGEVLREDYLKLQVVLAQDFTWVYGAHAVLEHVFLLCTSLPGGTDFSAVHVATWVDCCERQ